MFNALLLSFILLFQPQVLEDADHDGLDDIFVKRLLEKFTPKFFVSSEDCDSLPAEFVPGSRSPTVLEKNGTIYGQVSRPSKAPDQAFIEIHYYHLWGRDCGISGHDLDAEHVSVLIRADSLKAVFWYAAAHEDTICETSRAARALTMDAEDRGPLVWISKNKHASFLNESKCNLGCGENRCVRMVEMPRSRVINIGELGYPMNGATWVQSERLSLERKMGSDFPDLMIVRLRDQGMDDVLLTNTPLPPTQEIILAGNSAFGALLRGGVEGAQGTGKALKVTGKSLLLVGRKLRLVPIK